MATLLPSHSIPDAQAGMMASHNFTPDDDLYDWISSVIPQRVYFGPYPNQTMCERLLDESFDVIIDLTSSEIEASQRFCLPPPGFRYREVPSFLEEDQIYGIVPASFKRVAFPIEDNHCPADSIKYCRFIAYVIESFMIPKKKIYIHCRGGHSRSGMMCVSLVCVALNYELQRAIEFVSQAHHDRKHIRDWWKNRRIPINYAQHMFLKKVHRSLVITDPAKYYNWLICDHPPELHKFLYNSELNYKLQLTYFRRLESPDFEQSYLDRVLELRYAIFCDKKLDLVEKEFKDFGSPKNAEIKQC